MKNTGEKVETPLMAQYNQIKAKHPEAILLFRVGDFYETFGQDAVRTSKALGIVLTKRANGAASHIELAGFPHHSLDNYLPKLVKNGFRVAICDQLEDPKATKTIVKRGITEMVSPGVSILHGVLEENAPNFLAALYLSGDLMGMAFLDISTGEFKVNEDKIENGIRLLGVFNPAEILVPKSQAKLLEALGIQTPKTAFMDDWVFGQDHAMDTLKKQFQTHTLAGFGIEEWKNAQRAAGACLHYLAESRHDHLPHIISLEKIESGNYVYMDRFTVRNLELIRGQEENSRSLFEVVNATVTPMGARLLRNWLCFPLKEEGSINDRLEIVSNFLLDLEWTQQIQEEIAQVGDLERLLSRIALQKVNPRELWTLVRGLKSIQVIQLKLEEKKNPKFLKILSQIKILDHLIQLLEHTLHPEAPVNLSKGNVIADGFHSELDDLRSIAFGGKDYLINLQKREAEKSGISSLKIGFNSVFGYYFEVTHIHRDKIPSDWIRKQTLVSAERYISAELKEYEEKILGAEDKIMVLETQLYRELVEKILCDLESLKKNAFLISYLDVLVNFAIQAHQKNYSRPEFIPGNSLKIWEGRHPVIEESLSFGEKYISNDLWMNPPENQILMITGPNMSGKSAILRQTALIVIMAQIGSYVPASKVEMGIVDKVFTRVGASDNVSAGQSTFMVEMIETATILNNVSENSLILLDEIGRGTSTYDGISIAWSIAEFLNKHPKFKAKTLFATHYHELNEMENLFPGIKNYSISVKETGDRVLFLRKLIPGGSEHSFGIHVAKMAGIPSMVVKRAQELLMELEKGKSPWMKENSPDSLKGSPEDRIENRRENKVAEPTSPYFQEIQSEILNLNLDHITPMEALMVLSGMKKKLIEQALGEGK